MGVVAGVVKVLKESNLKLRKVCLITYWVREQSAHCSADFIVVQLVIKGWCECYEYEPDWKAYFCGLWHHDCLGQPNQCHHRFVDII